MWPIKFADGDRFPSASLLWPRFSKSTSFPGSSLYCLWAAAMSDDVMFWHPVIKLIRIMWHLPRPPRERITNKPVDMHAAEAVMSSNMQKISWLVLLICLHFSHGSDPQPEQIHLSSTGNSSFKYIKERKVVNWNMMEITSVASAVKWYVVFRLLSFCNLLDVEQKIHDNQTLMKESPKIETVPKIEHYISYQVEDKAEKVKFIANAQLLYLLHNHRLYRTMHLRELVD